MQPGEKVIERKKKPDGSVREYACTVAAVEGGLLVIRYRMDAGGKFETPVRLPAGSVSYGFFWRRRPYNLYRFTGQGGEVLGHRLDAVAQVRWGEGVVEYRDLELDWWVLPGDVVVGEDSEEFESAVESGVLRAADVARARTAEREVLSRYRHIIDEAAEIHARYGLRP
jgi:hypothetical protein